MMISLEEALSRILAAFEPLPMETVGLDQGLGRVLGEDVVARVTQPPTAVSAMDGYAVQATDIREVPADLQVIGEAPAGRAFPGTMGSGEAVRIFTGGPVPEGADTVVIQENCDVLDGQVRVKQTADAGQFVRPAGLDFRAGDCGAAAGKLLTARDIGLAAAMNNPWLRVRRRPRIAILGTGDEVVMPGEPLGQDQIVGSNAFGLAALIRACGGEAINLGIAKDSTGSLQPLLRGAAGSDLLVTTGGVSVGAHDLVHQALEREGLELAFWKIAIRPGKPILFGKLGATAVLGLPGNPVSTLVCGVLLVRPIIDRLLGRSSDAQPDETAILGADLGENDRRQDYLRATLAFDATGRPVAIPFQRQDSSMLATLAQADCLIVRPPHAPAASAGESVPILTLNWGTLAF